MHRVLTCLAASLILPTVLFAAPPRYVLTVTGGTGSGAYLSGTKVRIAAHPINPPAHFHHWAGDTQTVADPSRAVTTLVMPDQAMRVQAQYTEPRGWLAPEGSPR